MEQERSTYLQQIPPENWQKTPDSVKKLMEEMAQRLEKLEQQQAEVLAAQQQLLEKVNRTSKNSSLPPSQDPAGFGKQQKQKSTKRRGGQPGHDGHSRNLYPIKKCSDVREHHPTT